MSTAQIEVERHDAVALVTLNAPARLNAIDAAMGDELDAALADAGADPRVRVVMITGAGRGFCSGASMARLDDVRSGAAPLSSHDASVFAVFAEAPPQFRSRYTAPLALPKPVIAAVNGACAGAGLMLALACDIRIASSEARFVASFARMGLIAESSASFLLGRIAGHGFASDMLLSARAVDASEAYLRGLVTQVQPIEGFRETALGLAVSIARETSPRSTRFIKRQLQHALAHDLATSLDLAQRGVGESLQWPDLVEGIEAFREKRPPRFPDIEDAP